METGCRGNHSGVAFGATVVSAVEATAGTGTGETATEEDVTGTPPTDTIAEAIPEEGTPLLDTAEGGGVHHGTGIDAGEGETRAEAPRGEIEETRGAQGEAVETESNPGAHPGNAKNAPPAMIRSLMIHIQILLVATTIEAPGSRAVMRTCLSMISRMRSIV